MLRDVGSTEGYARRKVYANGAALLLAGAFYARNAMISFALFAKKREE